MNMYIHVIMCNGAQRMLPPVRRFGLGPTQYDQPLSGNRRFGPGPTQCRFRLSPSQPGLRSTAAGVLFWAGSYST